MAVGVGGLKCLELCLRKVETAMRKQSVQKTFLRLMMLSLAVVLIGGGAALLYQLHQGTAPGHAASSGNVVGPPALPAATVDAILRQMGSPMVGVGKAVEAASRAQNIDDAFALGVWWTETNDGAAGVGLADRNPGSVRGSIGYPSAFDGYTIYPSYTAAVNYWFMMMRRVYIDRGLTTVWSISHPYVGTSTSNLWAGKVFALMQRYRAEAPPMPTVTPKPTIPANILRVQRALQQQEQAEQAQSGANPVAVPVIPQSVIRHADPVAAPGLSGSVKTILVLGDLLLALTLALWAASVHRQHSARPAKTEAQPTGHLWEDLRASHQQPSAFFGQHSLSGLLPTTEGLPPGLEYTEPPVTTNPLLPVYTSSQAIFTPARDLSGSITSASTTIEQLPFDDLNAGYSSTGPLPALSVPANIHTHGPLHRIGLLPAHSSTNPTWQPPVTADERNQSPQSATAVGSSVGRSNGLLSRYKEMQTVEER